MQTVVLVEGVSDAAALLALAARTGRDLGAEGVTVVPMGGATNVRRFVERYADPAVRLVGLCDANEARFFRKVLDDEAIFVCVTDLEDELIRALGTERVERVLEENGDLPTFRTMQNQPAQRDRTLEQQLHRFFGTTGGRKERYGSILVAALEPDRMPAPLTGLLRR